MRLKAIQFIVLSIAAMSGVLSSGGCSPSELDCAKEGMKGSRVFVGHAGMWVRGQSPNTDPCPLAFKKSFCVGDIAHCELAMAVAVQAVADANPWFYGGTSRIRCEDTGKTKGPRFHHSPEAPDQALPDAQTPPAVEAPILPHVEGVTLESTCGDTSTWKEATIPGTPPPTTCPGVDLPTNVTPCEPCFVAKCCAVIQQAVKDSGAGQDQVLAVFEAWMTAGTPASSGYPLPAPSTLNPYASKVQACMVGNCQGSGLGTCTYPATQAPPQQ